MPQDQKHTMNDKVKLVAKTVGVGEYDGLDTVQLIEKVARHGRDNEDRAPGRLLGYLLKHGHVSPLEQVNYTFRIQTSRAISAQLARHNGKIQERSLRYDAPPGIEPIEIRRKAKTNRQSSEDAFDPNVHLYSYPNLDLYSHRASEAIDDYLRQGRELYEGLVAEGVARECARAILPMSSSTTIHVNSNLRDWLSFLNQRCSPHAQKEAREIAYAIGEALERELPDFMAMIDWRAGHFLGSVQLKEGERDKTVTKK